MYKSKLQELCQQWRWPLPEYNTVKDGPQHLPRFIATVNVNGHTFYTPTHHKSAKEAQNNAAHVAVYHLSALSAQVLNYSSINYSSVNYPSVEGYQLAPTQLMHQAQYQVADFGQSLPISPLPSVLPIPNTVLVTRNDPQANMSHEGMLVQHNLQKAVQNSTDPVSSSQVQKGKLHIYKNLLQRFAQKKSVALPVYDTKVEGPGHALRFKSRVSVDGQSYDTPQYFTTLKEAEQAVAKVACEALSLNGDQGDNVSYKNRLQELAMRKGLDHPTYKTSAFGLPHKPAFISRVELGSLAFQGGEAKTKKQAEMDVAKVAYNALIDCSQPANSSISPSVDQLNLLCYGKTQPENFSIPSYVDQSSIAGNQTQDIEEKPSTRKQTDVLDEEAQLQLKRVKTSAEHENVNPNPYADAPSSSYVILSPANPDPAHDEFGNVKPADPAVILSPDTGSSSRTIVVPHKTNLVTPDGSSASILPISDDQWVAYKVEVNQDPGTTA